jgi:DNA polymerase-1
VTGDPALVQAFAQDEDIHAATAARVLGLPIDQIDKQQRRIAKTVNFGLIYGQSAFGLSQTIGIPQSEARDFIKTYFEKYPGVKDYIDTTEKLAADRGYLTTLLGRRRDFSQLASLTGPQRARVEREAINMPIQGTAADIMKQAMINLHAELKQRKLQTKMLLQVHDELVLEAPEEEVVEAAKLAKEVMCNAFELRVPVKVEVEVGQNWLEMEKVQERN